MKPIFNSLHLSMDVMTRISKADSVMQLYVILLEQFNNNFRQLVLIMKQVFTIVVHDDHKVSKLQE